MSRKECIPWSVNFFLRTYQDYISYLRNKLNFNIILIVVFVVFLCVILTLPEKHQKYILRKQYIMK